MPTINCNSKSNRFIPGFNLHAEKGKPGQYVGKVDSNSPAEESGLREGDRILEVNGVDIGSETHKQVVERIKAIPSETTLLVLDPSPIVQQHHSRTNGTSSSSSTTTIITTNNNMSPVNNNHHNGNGKVNDATTNGTGKSSSSSPTMSESRTKTASNGGSPSLSINNNQSDKMMTNQHNGNGAYDHSNNSFASDNNKSPMMATKTQGQLNLKMTAAEMRAMLQAKKKYDPKNDTIDLRKKHDIIDKL